MANVRDVLKECVQLIDRYRGLGRRIGEQNTKATLIEPVISVLGWDVQDPEEVYREYRRRPTDNPVDYALLLRRTPRLFVEAKGFGENLDDPRWANQTISYAAVAGVEWVLLTDGASWRVYNTHAPVPVEQKLFRSVAVDDDLDGAMDLLALLSKANMRDNRIDELWKDFYVDRQVRHALEELFNGDEPARGLVNLVHKHVQNLARTEIRASLMRARATFNFPAAGPIIDDSHHVIQLPRPPAGPRRPPDSKPRHISEEEKRVSVADLLTSGRLRAGDALDVHYRGHRHTAEIQADGTIRFAGSSYSSLSSAGTAVKEAILGADIPHSIRATDGWSFWRATDVVNGDHVTMRQIRHRVVQQSHHTGDH
jgi:hypothetical protein